jgi:hypothetical protein
MQEFESISASSYDPSALAIKLTAKAAEGWSVVAIVPTGGDVTAFVTRQTNGADESTDAAETTEAAESEDTGADAAAPMLAATADPEPEGVDEPAGWAIAPEPASPAAEPAAAAVAAAAVADPTPSYQPSSSYQPAAAAAAAAPVVSAPDPAPTPAVPAGWYADPAGRFELRYWDGSTWTEHVSRAGQQFTDPPVA